MGTVSYRVIPGFLQSTMQFDLGHFKRYSRDRPAQHRVALVRSRQERALWRQFEPFSKDGENREGRFMMIPSRSAIIPFLQFRGVAKTTIDVPEPAVQ